MRIGCLGDIVFSVSANVIKTISNLEWSGSAIYAEHQRHLSGSLVEYVGMNPDTLSFETELSVYMGVNPMTEINKIVAYERAGRDLYLVIGTKVIGRYKWVIKSHKVKGKHYDKNGDILSATVTIDLLEYLKS